MSSSEVNLQNYQIPLDEINRATENFSQQGCIGGGGFGAVYKGRLSEHWGNRTAAIKRLSRDSYQGEHEFYNELQMISRFNHENIISFIGYCDEENEMIIVYDYATNESLDHHLRDPKKMCCITWIQRLNICIGAARGLNYLHSGLGEHKRVIHRDVKSGNILLDGNFVAKICDFGLSKSGPRNQPNTKIDTKVAGTQFYMDPTYQESRILRKESDIYSFGVVLFEILSGMLVYRERSIEDEHQFLMNSVRRYHQTEQDKLIDPYIRDQIDSRSFDTFQEIAYGCISFNLLERPTLDIIIKKIEEALTIQISKRSASIRVEPLIVESLLRKLNSSSPYDQRTAVSEIRLLSKINAANRNIFAGAIPLLTNLLTAPDSRTQEQTVTALLNLSICEDNKVRIMYSGAVHGIIQLLKEGSMEARENAAATLFSLCIINENKVTIGAAGAIPPLVSLLSVGTLRGKKDAATALFNLCLYHGNKGMSVRAGVVPILMEHLREPEGLLKHEALANLVLLSTHPEGKLAIGKENAVPVLVEVIGSGFQKNKENAASVLLNLSSSDKEYLVEAQQHGVMGYLTDLLQHGTDRGKEKAEQLLEKIEDHPEDEVLGNLAGLLHYGTERGKDIDQQVLEDHAHGNDQCDAEIIGADRKPSRLLNKCGNLKNVMFNIPQGAQGSSSTNVKSNNDEYFEITLDNHDDSVAVHNMKTASGANVRDLGLILNTTELENRSSSRSAVVRNVYEEFKRLTHISR